MKRQKVGLIIFWIGTLYIIIMGFVTSYWVRGAYRYLSLEEVRETIWSYTNPLFGLWVVSVPLGAILVAIGLLIYVQAKSSHIWMFGIGTFSVLLIDILEKFGSLPSPLHWPPLYGIGGALILLFFFGILWFWARRYAVLEESGKTVAEFQLVGYIFLMMAMWYLCGALSRPFQKVFEGSTPSSPVAIMVFLVLGWLFLFIGHYQSIRLEKGKDI